MVRRKQDQWAHSNHHYLPSRASSFFPTIKVSALSQFVCYPIRVLLLLWRLLALRTQMLHSYCSWTRQGVEVEQALLFLHDSKIFNVTVSNTTGYTQMQEPHTKLGSEVHCYEVPPIQHPDYKQITKMPTVVQHRKSCTGENRNTGCWWTEKTAHCMHPNEMNYRIYFQSTTRFSVLRRMREVRLTLFIFRRYSTSEAASETSAFCGVAGIGKPTKVYAEFKGHSAIQ